MLTRLHRRLQIGALLMGVLCCASGALFLSGLLNFDPHENALRFSERLVDSTSAGDGGRAAFPIDSVSAECRAFFGAAMQANNGSYRTEIVHSTHAASQAEDARQAGPPTYDIWVDVLFPDGQRGQIRIDERGFEQCLFGASLPD